MAYFSRIGSAVALFFALTACGETLDLYSEDMGVGRTNGEDCTASTACASGFCVDGVCCESSCTGTCEICNADGKRGSCVAAADGTDPRMQCVAVETGDGGVPDVDGGINAPDGGVDVMTTACSGTCNGTRACKFPGKEKSCGTSFCNDKETQLAYACTSNGGCALQETSCVAYSCGPDACRTSCTSQSDCLPTHYCNGSNQCVPKKDLAVQCQLGNECSSGFCAGDSANAASAKVCCDTACTNAIPGATCIAPGKEGTCQCTKDCTGKGSCTLSYPDADGDGFGNPLGATTVECSGAIPGGRTIDNTDCYDSNPHAYPGPRKAADQHCPSSKCCYPNWYFAHRGDGSFDYNCDNVETHQVNEWPVGRSCHFCDQVNNCNNADTSCASSGEGAILGDCGARNYCPLFSGYTCGSCYFVFLQCGSEQPVDTGYIGNVGCGGYGYRYSCGSCTMDGGGVSGTTNAYTQQGCM